MPRLSLCPPPRKTSAQKTKALNEAPAPAPKKKAKTGSSTKEDQAEEENDGDSEHDSEVWDPLADDGDAE